MQRGILEILRHSLSAEKHMCLVLVLQARQSPNTQDQAGCLKVATGHLFEVTSFTWHCGESPRAKLQKVSSEDFRTPVRGQAVKQNAMMRSALEFFATAQSCCERSLESVNRYRASHGDDGPPLQGQDSGKSSYVQWRKYRVGLHPRNLSSVFRLEMRTHSGVLISSVLSRSSLSVHPSYGLRHCYFRIVARLVNQYSGTPLAYSSFTMPLTQHFIAWCWAGIPTRSPSINTSSSCFFRCSKGQS